MMTPAHLDQNDKLLAAGKKEKLEYVTPKMTLMESDTTSAKRQIRSFEGGTALRPTLFGPS